MGRIRYYKNGIVNYDIWMNIYCGDLRSTAIEQVVLADLEEVGLTLEEAVKYIWFLDLKPEGINAHDLEHLYKFLVANGLDTNNFRVAFSCVEDVSVLPYPAVCIPDRLIYNGNWYHHLLNADIDWKNMPMTHKFVCLMRRPSLSRAHLARRLLANFNRDDIILSFATSGTQTSQEIIELIKPHPCPLIVDHTGVDRESQHNFKHDLFYRAPLKLVVESSSQTDPDVWRSIFITEKTFKACSWHQFLIWYAVPGLVNEVRKLGFDVFDDLFENHYYDTIEDPWVRMTQVVLLLKRTMQQDVVELRKQHWERMEFNACRVGQVFQNSIVEHPKILQELLDRK